MFSFAVLNRIDKTERRFLLFNKNQLFWIRPKMHPALFLIWVISDAEGISMRTERACSDAYLGISPVLLAA